ncbi:MAG: hypothetical protein JNK53_03340 [Phycisphaerae bacterium]|nr:hypothetical protein [Phycisphaerae bacterium]
MVKAKQGDRARSARQSAGEVQPKLVRPVGSHAEQSREVRFALDVLSIQGLGKPSRSGVMRRSASTPFICG